MVQSYCIKLKAFIFGKEMIMKADSKNNDLVATPEEKIYRDLLPQDAPIENELKDLAVNSYYIEHISQYNGTGDNVVVSTRSPVNQLLRYHSHDFFEINYVHYGECINMIEGVDLHMKSGDFVILHPDTLHTLYADSTCFASNFLISINWMQSLLLRFTDVERTDAFYRFCMSVKDNNAYKYIYFNASAATTEIAEQLVNSFEISFRSLYREAFMIEFLCKAFECNEAVLSAFKGTSSSKFKSILNYIVLHYDTVTLDEICRVFYYTKPYVCRLFKENTGNSFCENVKSIRLRNAEALLSSTKLTVEQIAIKVGYSNVEYFYRVFHSRFGMTPLEFRASLK